MVAAITKTFTFEASHVLPEHDGKCKRLHGHSYRAEVELEGAVQNQPGSSNGMVMDYGALTSCWDAFADDFLDHRHLNDTLPVTPTAENIAAWILQQFQAWNHLLVRAVTVYETVKTSARVESTGP